MELFLLLDLQGSIIILSEVVDEHSLSGYGRSSILNLAGALWVHVRKVRFESQRFEYRREI